MTIQSRPRIRIAPTPTDMVVEAAALAGVAFATIAVAAHWPQIPQTVPTHFDVAGKADGWGPKSMLAMLPALTAAMYVVLTVLSRFPHVGNYPFPITDENAERVYRVMVSTTRWLKMELVWTLAYLTFMNVQVALGNAKDLGATVMPMLLAVILVTTVVMIVRLYRAK